MLMVACRHQDGGYGGEYRDQVGEDGDQHVGRHVNGMGGLQDGEAPPLSSFRSKCDCRLFQAYVVQNK